MTILAELGDCRRFSSSRDASATRGLDITVHQSDQRRAPGHLSRQGPPALRWALFEAAQVARRPGSPGPRLLHPGRRAPRRQPCLPRAVARKLLKRSYHTLTELGEDALRPPEPCHARAALDSHRCTAASSPHAPAAIPCRAWTALKDRAAATPSAGSPHQPSCRRPGHPAGSWTEIRLGARAHTHHPTTAPTHPLPPAFHRHPCRRATPHVLNHASRRRPSQPDNPGQTPRLTEPSLHR